MEKFNYASFQDEAEALLKDAREKAQQLIANAAAEAERIRETAHKDGFEAGRAEGTLHAIEKIVGEVDRHRGELQIEAERDLVRLALAIAEKIVKQQVKLGKPVAEANLKAAIAQAARAHVLEVRVNPAEARRLEKSSAAIQFVADESIAAGGCIVRTAEGIIDASLQAQLDQIERGLLGTRK